MQRSTRLVTLVGLIALFVTALPVASDAQWRVGVGVGVHRGVYGYPYWGSYWGPYSSPMFLGGPWYPYVYPYAQYPRRVRARDVGAEVRLQVKPTETQVYLDGYYVGVAGDFDGVFERLPVPPGEHEIVLYLKGYTTVKQTIRVSQGEESRIRYTMVKVGPGETSEPPPVAPPRPPDAPAAGEPEPPGTRRPGAPPQPLPRTPPPSRGEAVPPPPGAGAPYSENFGSVAIRVQPADAEVFIDGQRWQGPESDQPLIVQVSEGPHRVEVRKEGFVTYSSEVHVRRGETTPLNISLPPRGE